jgi:hypothetical protein
MEEEGNCPNISSLDDYFNYSSGPILYKKNFGEVTEQYYEFPWRAKDYLYDALGRSTYNDRKTKRFLFNKKKHLNTPNEPLVLLREVPVTDSYGNRCGVFGSGGDYGFVTDNYLNGGKTCHEVDAPILGVESVISREVLPDRCGKGKNLIRVYGEIPVNVILSRNKIFYVREGDIIPGLYNVLGMNAIDKATEIQMCKHEVGHQRDNARIIQNAATIYISLDVTGCDYGCANAKAKEFLEEKREKIKKDYNELIETATKEYHNVYNHGGAPNEVECHN